MERKSVGVGVDCFVQVLFAKRGTPMAPRYHAAIVAEYHESVNAKAFAIANAAPSAAAAAGAATRGLAGDGAPQG